MTAALVIVFLFGLILLPIVVVVVVAKASRNYSRNVALAGFLESSPDLKPVGVGYRLLAFLLDVLVLGAVFGLIAAGIDAMLGYESESVTLLVALVAWFAYFAGMEIIWGATVGKMALRLRVVRAGGGRPGLGAALVRNCCKIFGVYSLVGIITTIVCISGSPAAQRFGDRLVGTTVVRKPRKALSPSLARTPPVQAAIPAPTGVPAPAPQSEAPQTPIPAASFEAALSDRDSSVPPPPTPASVTARPPQAIGGFALSLVGFIMPVLWPIGIVLSSLDIRRERRAGQPHGLSLAGLLISSVGTTLALGVMVLLLAGTPQAWISGWNDTPQEARTKEGIRAIQAGIEAYEDDHPGLYPAEWDMNEIGMVEYVDSWPEDPYTSRPMKNSEKPGNYRYWTSGVKYELTGYGPGGEPIIVVP